MKLRELWVVVFVGLAGALLAASVHPGIARAQVGSLAGVWVVRREVQTVTACGDRFQPGDVLAGLWTIDSVAGRARVLWTGFGEFPWSSTQATVTGSQVQLTNISGERTSAILLSRNGDDIMIGTETLVAGTGCVVTRAVTAQRLRGAIAAAPSATPPVATTTATAPGGRSRGLTAADLDALRAAAVPSGRFRTDTSDVDESGDGEFDQRVLVRMIQSRAPAIRACYDVALVTNPSLAGMLRVRMTLQPDGEVTGVAVTQSTIADAQVGACVVVILDDLRFRPGPTGGSVTYAFPFVFEPTPQPARDEP